ncbi:hypothetical protein H0H87_011060 [Tephrocybe sp. NHM501043]|nr:hypothetical protein H0H87_011060 [Tephrocybe sp. NHM501043]
MADTSSTHLREQNENEKRGKIQRRRPKITLMDSVLRTPLKSTKRLQHNPVTPGTPPSIKSDKKRKFRSVSSSRQ